MRILTVIKSATIVLAAFFALQLAAGCARKEAAKDAAGAGADAPRTIRFWQFWDTELIAPLVAQFEAAHPGIDVEMETLTWASGFEKIVVAIASGKAPDLVELGSTWVPKFAAEGALRDLTPDVAALRDSLVQWESGMRDGRVFAVPWLVGTRVLFVNQDLLAAAAADTAPPATWAALRDASRAAHAPAAGRYGFGMNAGERHVLYKKFLPFAWSNGGDVLDAAGRPAVTAPAFVEALEYYASLVPHSLLERQDQLDLAFLEGRLAFTISGGWLVKQLGDKGAPFRWTIAPLPRPSLDAPPSASFAGAEMLAIPATSRHAADALALARFLVAGERALVVAESERSVLPAAHDAAVQAYCDANPLEAVQLAVLRTSKAPPAHPAWVEMQEALNTAIEDVLFGKAEPAAAMQAADAKIAAALASR
jgi:multiple sugar transport system substrate-binding protein